MKIIDFSGKRVKVDGKSVSKFDLASLCDRFEIHYYNRLNTVLFYDSFSYDEFKEKLRKLITEHHQTSFESIIL